MKAYTILEAINFVEYHSILSAKAIRSISYIGNSESKFKIGFNDDTVYFFDLDDGSYYIL